MAAVLSAEVRQALQDIYYNERTGRGQAAFALLERASAAGDGDASCLLARCLCGPQYVWAGHGFPEDDDRAAQLMRLSVQQGSALGVLVALRSGELPPEREAAMPFASLQDAFDEVVALAEGGDAFCQYVVGNSYFWWDFLRIQHKGQADFPDATAFARYLRQNILKCEDWFHRALEGGIYFAASNLRHLYLNGDGELILPRREKAANLWRTAAVNGHPLPQSIFAGELVEEGNYLDAVYWYRQAAEGGQPGAWSDLGQMYFEGKGTDKDEAYAVRCFERDLANDCTSAYNRLGKAYYTGRGVPQDYAKAYQLLTHAYRQGSKWGAYYLGKCCYEGWGTARDYAQARAFLEQVDWDNSDTAYMLGCIYGQGLDVVPNPDKAVAYLQKAGDNANAQQELRHYKKTLLTRRWVRR